MHALDAMSGKEAWSFQTGARIDSSPALAGGRGYVGSNDGKLYVFDYVERQDRPAVRRRWATCPHHPQSRRAASSSDLRTANCSVSGKTQTLICGPDSVAPAGLEHDAAPVA